MLWFEATAILPQYPYLADVFCHNTFARASSGVLNQFLKQISAAEHPFGFLTTLN